MCDAYYWQEFISEVCVLPVSVFLMWTTWGSRILSDWGLLFRIDVEEATFPGLGWPEFTKIPPPVSTDFKCGWVALECWALRSMETLLAGSVMAWFSSGVGRGNGGVNSGFWTPLLGSTDMPNDQCLRIGAVFESGNVFTTKNMFALLTQLSQLKSQNEVEGATENVLAKVR